MFMICSFRRKTVQRMEGVVSKLDFWAFVAVGTQLVLAAVVQLTVLS